MKEIEKEMQKITKWRLSFVKTNLLRKLIDKLWYKVFKKKINKLIKNEIKNALAKINIKSFDELFSIKDIPTTQKPMFKIKNKK